jgi:GntR family transcriptional repressor for pyruvate dehydrogenase complex
MESKKVKKVEIEKIKRTSVAEKIAEELIRMVDSGDFEPGEALPPERDLAEMFGVGRSSVREALRALQAVGIVEKRQGGGTYIHNPPNTAAGCFNISGILQRYSMMELSEARMIIEEQTVALAAKNATQDNVEAMEEANAKLLKALEAYDPEAIVDLDMRVHQAIADGANNTFITEMLDMLLRIFSEANKAVLTPDKVESAVDFHKRIIDCIRVSDAKSAVKEMEAHLADVRKRIIVEAYGTENE